MFPIGIMWYFGTNLDSKFSVQGFWPSKEQSNKVPRERQELDEELNRLKTIRLNLRQKRLEEDALMRGDFDEVRKLREERENASELASVARWPVRQKGREG
jgi:protein PET100, fungi type